MSDVYNSSTDGPIPLNFEGRRLMANLRDAIQDAIKAADFNHNDRALSRARAAIAKELSIKQSLITGTQALARGLQQELEAAGRVSTEIRNQYAEASRANLVLRNERDVARRALQVDLARQVRKAADIEDRFNAQVARADALEAQLAIAKFNAQLAIANFNAATPEPRYAVFVVCDPWDSEIRVVKRLTASGARAAQAHPAHGRTICIPESVLADLEYLPGGKVRNHKPNWDAIRKAAVSP